MWLVTAVGPVLGQRHFTFALEQRRTYTVGRLEASDICFSAKNVRPLEGVLDVGDWNPADPTTPPSLVWRAEPKKNGSFNPLKVVSQADGEVGSYRKDDYKVEEMADTTALELSEPGQGIELAADVWFSTHWRPLHFCYDQMKNETDDNELYRKHCVAWTAALEPSHLPDVLISPALVPNNDCTYAVCYGVPIVLPSWLQMLAVRLRSCWKKVPDSHNSFSIPDITSPEYEPPIAPDSVKKQRGDRRAWRADKANQHLFSGYRVVGIGKTALSEKKWFVTMGAEWDDLDVFSTPLSSGADFLDRLAPSMNAAAAAGREVLIAYLPSARKAMEAMSINFDSVVLGTCASNGILIYGAAKVLWGAVMYGSVAKFFDALAAHPRKDESASTPAVDSPRTSQPPEATPQPQPQPGGRLIRRAASRTTSRSVSRAPSPPPAPPASAVPQPDVVTSSVADDAEDVRETSTPSAAAPASTSGPKKPLRRRANRDAPRVDLDADWDMPGGDGTPASSLPQASHVPETQLSAPSQSQAGGTFVPDSMDVDQPTGRAATSAQASTSRSRLKRRAGGATQSSFLEGLDTSVQYEEDWKKKEAASEIQQLYESSKRETASLAVNSRASKRQRVLESVGEAGEEAQFMDIDEDDYVAKALRSARNVKKEVASPAKAGTSAASAPAQQTVVEEEAAGLPERSTRGRAAPKKVAKPAQKEVQQHEPAGDVTKDEAFLQAIKSAKGKKDIDELDKEFNQLRIPKPANGRPEVRAWKPDYKVLDDFDTNVRGNFIEVVKKDLFRKDAPRKALPVTDDGRPNFKKFKKKNIVRRQPVHLVLSAQNAHAAEMGEPYWAVEDVNTQKRTQATQASSSRRGGGTQTLDDDDDAPLLPRTKGKRRLLSQIQEADDDDEILSLPAASRRRGATPATQDVAAARSRGRSTRAGSVASEASSASVAAPPAKPVRRAATRGTARSSRAIEVLDDSDSDGAAFATARSSTRARRGTAVQPSATIDFDDEPPRSTRATVASGSTRASARRKLLVDDDDDTTFRGVQKKRRLE